MDKLWVRLLMLLLKWMHILMHLGIKLIMMFFKWNKINCNSTSKNYTKLNRSLIKWIFKEAMRQSKELCINIKKLWKNSVRASFRSLWKLEKFTKVSKNNFYKCNRMNKNSNKKSSIWKNRLALQLQRMIF